MTTKLIVDCDTGVDDALALLYLAVDSDAEVVAAGSVHGNVPSPLAAQNTLRVLEFCGLGVPVSVGCERPLAQPLTTGERVHGDDGLGNTFQPVPLTQPVSRSQAEQIVGLTREQPGNLVLLATGPLTNLAIAILLEPQLPKLVERVVIMGGAISVPGNATPLAEANIWHDPEAAELVQSADWDVTLVGLDVTMRALLEGARLQRLESTSSKRARFVSAILAHYVTVYERYVGVRASALHDPLAAAIALDRSLVRCEELPVRVELRGTESRGATIADLRPSAQLRSDDGRPAIKVATEADSERFLERFLERMIGEQ